MIMSWLPSKNGLFKLSIILTCYNLSLPRKKCCNLNKDNLNSKVPLIAIEKITTANSCFKKLGFLGV
jgi:hypothetical protein